MWILWKEVHVSSATKKASWYPSCNHFISLELKLWLHTSNYRNKIFINVGFYFHLTLTRTESLKLFLDSSESLAANLGKIKANLCMTNGSKVLIHLIFFFFELLTRLNLCGKIKKDKKIRTFEPFVIQGSSLLFRGWQPNY